MTASSFINYMCIAYSTLVGLYCIVNSYSNESNSSETVNCLTNIVTMELKMSYLIILCCALIPCLWQDQILVCIMFLD